MASTSTSKFDKSSSGAAPSLAALVVVLLLGVVLAGSFAPACASIGGFPDLPLDLPGVPGPAPEVGVTKFQVDNNLDGDNDVNCTITEPLVGTAKSFFIKVNGTVTVTIQLAQPLSSLFNCTVFGKDPLGGGKLYSTGADNVQRIVSLGGYRFALSGTCPDENSNTGLLIRGFTKPPPPANPEGVFINCTCAALQKNN